MNEVRSRSLDDVDTAIVRLLSERARLPNNALAAAVGIAPSTCLGRVRSLQERGVIRGYQAEIDLSALGLPLQAMIAVRMQAHSREQVESFVSSAPALPGVVEVFHVAGGNDYLIHVAAADPTGLHDFVIEHLVSNPAIAHAETNLIFRHIKGANVLAPPTQSAMAAKSSPAAWDT
ncbi:MAG: Lrp/AsnC family transcriptional regulator [Nocardioidaceae bacterium]